MVVDARTDASVASALKMRVDGMDCSACAIKVENALKRLPGVSDINMSYATEMLSLRLDENRTSRDGIEKRIRDLGYTPMPLTARSPARRGNTQEEADDAGDQAWWKTRKGRWPSVWGRSLRWPSRSPRSGPI